MLKSICLSICMLISAWCFAQQEQIQFSRLDLSDGLSHNEIKTIFKDARGFLWVGTLAGLNRYDGYDFKVFKHDPSDSTSISDDEIVNIFELPDHKLYLQTRGAANIYDPEQEIFIRNTEPYLKKLQIRAAGILETIKDKEGNFWFNTGASGLFRYSPGSKSTQHYPLGGAGGTAIHNNLIADMQLDDQGNLWLIHRDQVIEMLDRKQGIVRRRLAELQLHKSDEFQDFKLFIDRDGDFWIYTFTNQRGVLYYSPQKRIIRSIDKGPTSLNNNLVSGILQDAAGRIWIGTDHGGINVLNKNDFSFRYLTNKEDDPKSIGQNSVTCLYKDPSGIIWLGTYKKGIAFYHKKILKFPLYRHQYANPGGLTYEDINRFVEDDKGNLWIGTNGGGLFYFNRKTGQFKSYKHESGNPNSLSSDIIVSLYIDRSQQLWVGSYFGGLSRFDGKNFKHYRHDSKDSNSIADDRVWDVLEDSQHRIWVATLSGGLDLLDLKTGHFSHKKASQANSVGSDFISCVIEDHKGNIWIGSSQGLDKMDRNGHFSHFKSKPGDTNALANNVIYSLLEDSYGFIWVATRDGLSRFDQRTGHFRNFDAQDGLTEKATLKIVEDADRNLWLSTANGLFNIIVKAKDGADFSYTFRKYDEHDGLQGSAFNANAGYRCRSGELAFGGANGFNLFFPKSIDNDHSLPKLVLSDLQIANRKVGIGKTIDGRVILEKSLAFSHELALSYAQNGFTIGFSALSYFNPQKIKYRYRLLGFDKEWQELSANNRRATYTNIDPGSYTFEVISTDASGNWVDNKASLKVTILPPFYRTWLAYLIYVVLIGGTLLLIRDRGIKRIKKEFTIQQERQQSKRMHELDRLKIKFFTNVSHEFRTPLSLIITPLEKMIRQAKEEEKGQLQMIHRNGRRLLNLVNQLLDFRRLEVQELRLHLRSRDIVEFIKELSLSFTDVAEQKHVQLHFNSNRNSLVTCFDQDKIERILFNLLSNAFKFTPQGGKVTVALEITPQQEENVELVLKVSDTGIGIAPDKKEQIFERFFQSDIPDSMVNQGSGIGLSITREFVKLHGGTIGVESKLNEGTCFIVSFVFSAEQHPISAQRQPLTLELNPKDALPYLQVDAGLNSQSKKPILMLIEDNEDFRFYLKDNLREYYQVVEAGNGKEAWQRILASHPDLIVSDVSMPEMDGIELCRKLKADNRTAHIPVILLTALTTDDQQLTGLETGASDYMTKPFNFEILLSKIRNLLQQQALSKKTYRKQLEIRPVETEVESVNEKFIRQLSLNLEKHLDDSSYTVDQLSSEMNMSRVGLYKKMIPITGKSPLEYIRFYRLQKSQALLIKSQLTIAEIAYQVGFSNPKHFSKYFKQEFGLLPSEFIAKNRDIKPDATN